MSLLRYNDHCEILRVVLTSDGTAAYDEYDEPLMHGVYKGACHYAPQGWNNSPIAVRNSAVYLPKAISVSKGDSISISDARGETWHGVVGDVRVLILPLSGATSTKIEVIRERE